ncbi:hypothetical protein, partial [Enterobacter cloacae complex sp. P30U]|uniref:hypothetical protein n=1 Tax=Enterobacter cloacae complex sp. P30U TaxID=2779561 RepID=UPI001D02F17A
SERIPAAAGIVNLRYKSCPEMAGQDQPFVVWVISVGITKKRIVMVLSGFNGEVKTVIRLMHDLNA